MAKFQEAYDKTNGNEGGWQNDPHDAGNAKGGPGTYKGISSANFPAWRGWSIIKPIIANMTKQPAYGSGAYTTWVHALNGFLASNSGFQGLVQSFYLANFWGVNRLTELVSQAVANKVYDSGVNQGTGTAARILQECLGVSVDGELGSVSLAAANKADGPTLAQAFKEARKTHYRQLVEKHPANAQYLNVWLARC